MESDGKLSILFCILNASEKIKSKLIPLNSGFHFTFIDEFDDPNHIQWETLDAVVFFYTPELEGKDSFYQLIKKIEKHVSLQRFLFFPKMDTSANTFPVIFHSVRFLEFHLYPYENQQETIENQEYLKSKIIQPFQELQENKNKEKIQQSQKDTHNILKRLKKSWKNPIYRLTVGISPIVALLIIVVISLFPNIFSTLTMFLNQSKKITPPVFSSYALDEIFPGDNSTTQWSWINKYKGTNYINSTSNSSKGIILKCNSPIQDSIYQATSITQYPFDDFSAFSGSFYIFPAENTSANGSTYFYLTQSKDPNKKIGCWTNITQNNGILQCLISDQVNEVQISNPVLVTFSEWHSFLVYYQREKQTVMLFVDDQFQGQTNVGSEPLWLGENYSLVVGTEVKDLNSGSIEITIGPLKIAEE